MKYKVRIKKAPQEMAYGGQSNFGLDLGAKNVYQDMTDNPYENISDTLQPVDRSLANIEAELGETIVGDFDQDGQNEHLKIGGKPHSQGGTPLKVPEKSFVFSKNKSKLGIGGPVLASFGKSATTKKKYSPADIAKQYNINDYKAILNNPYSDKIDKTTAARMIDNFEKKLGGLALLQESMKGFPQGIPDIAMPYMQTMMPQDENQNEEMPMAEYGGYYYQGGGQPGTPRKIKKEEIGDYEKKGYKRVGNTNVWRLETSGKEVKDPILVPGTPGNSKPGSAGQIIPGGTIKGGSGWKAPAGCENLLYTPADVKARPGCYNTFLNKNGFKDAPEEDMLRGLRDWKQGRRPTYKPGEPGQTVAPIKDTYKCSEEDIKKGFVYNPATGKCELPTKNSDEVTIDDVPGIPPPRRYYYNSNSGSLPFFGSQFMYPPKKYHPFASPLNAVLPDPTFYDPNRELAELASAEKMQSEYMANLDPQALNARLSALNAQGAEKKANTMGRYQNMNVGVANQFSPLRTDIMNKIMAYRADAMDKVIHNSQQEDKAYRNSARAFARNFDMYNMGRYMYNTKKNLMNAVNPWFELVDGPFAGNMQMRPGVTWDQMISGSFPGATANSGADPKEIEAEALRLKGTGLDAATINEILRRKFPTATASKGNSAASYAKNYMGLNFPGSNNSYSAYPFSQSGFDIEGDDG